MGAGESETQGLPWLHRDLKASLDYKIGYAHTRIHTHKAFGNISAFYYL